VAVEAYIPLAMSIDGRVVDPPVLITLYDAQGHDASGAITTAKPLSVGTEGCLRFKGTHGGRSWSVVIERISVTRQSAVGFECKINSPVRRTPIDAKRRSEDAVG
jgi:hypothetical protein